MSVGAAWNRVATNVWWPVVETRECNCGAICKPLIIRLVFLNFAKGYQQTKFVAKVFFCMQCASRYFACMGWMELAWI